MAIKAETRFSLKDQLFNPETVKQLSDAVAAAYPGFAAQVFQRNVLKAFPQLELKQRINCLVEHLGAALPADYAESLRVLEASLPVPLDPKLSDDDFGQFIWVVPGEFVARYGCRAEVLDESLSFLALATQRFSAENAIRPFLKQFPEQTMAAVMAWAEHENYHVRRLASEGIRPLLPWAEKVVLPTDQVITVLDKLCTDPTRYVVRSVANNLNDIAKTEPGQVIATLQRWQRQAGDNPELAWLTRHALRTLLNRDDANALALLGYAHDTAVAVRVSRFTESVRVGTALALEATLCAEQNARVLVSLRIHFLKANGQLKAKTFRLRDLRLKAGESVEITKRLPIKPATTRTLYPGQHQADIVINGKTCWQQPFELEA